MGEKSPFISVNNPTVNVCSLPEPDPPAEHPASTNAIPKAHTLLLFITLPLLFHVNHYNAF